jgi:hypothetical protein
MQQLTLDHAIQGATFDVHLDRERLNAQQLRVLTVMMDGQWRTLGEIQHAVADRSGQIDPEASISARLRDFRKVGCTVERRRRGEATVGLFEYRVRVPQGAAP